MKHIVMFSGGVTSWAAAKRVVARYGAASTTLLFADTRYEDYDLYRFLEEARDNIGAELIELRDGRTPWEVFFDERYLGNTRVDPCSRVLKRNLLDRWLSQHCDPENTLIAYGFDWSEGHRLERMRSYGGPWQRWAPLLQPPYLSKTQLIALLQKEGIEPPRLYAMGFSHNNCGGRCIKAGQASWALLLKHMPDRYRDVEIQEQQLREYLGKDVSILRDRTGGTTKPMTLKAFRERLEAHQQYDLLDWGACGCFQQADAEDPQP